MYKRQGKAIAELSIKQALARQKNAQKIEKRKQSGVAVLPGKEEFRETLRYFEHEVKRTGVTLRLDTRASQQELQGFDEVIVVREEGVSGKSLRNRPALSGRRPRTRINSWPSAHARREPTRRALRVTPAGGIRTGMGLRASRLLQLERANPPGLVCAGVSQPLAR